MCDDSVIRSDEGRMIPMRRSRGYAPLPIRLQLPAIANDPNEATWMAVGAEIKGTLCWVQQDYAILSQHLGDMENVETIQALERSVEHLGELYRSQPQVIAADLHPQYLSSQWAQRYAERTSIPLLRFQHHHAHVASLLAEHRWDPNDRIVAVCMDGTGYGTDGAIWGGECLEVRGLHWKRLAHCEYFGLPGGNAAIRYPFRTALSLLHASEIPWSDSWEPCRRGQSELRFLAKQMAQRTGVLPTSGMGRLFDAVASLIGVCHDATYEAQGAMELEALAERIDQDTERLQQAMARNYPWEVVTPDQTKEEPLRLLWRPLIHALLEDLSSGTDKGVMAWRFHRAMAEAIVAMVSPWCRAGDTVGLTGGVFQNVLLLRLARARLKECNFQTLEHEVVPCNDGGLALGQAWLAGLWLAQERTP